MRFYILILLASIVLANNAFAQRSSNIVIYQGPAIDSAPITFQDTVTQTATALDSTQFKEGFWVKASCSNKANIYLGGPLVTIESGWELAPCDKWFYHMTESDLLYAIGLDDTDKILITGN